MIVRLPKFRSYLNKAWEANGIYGLFSAVWSLFWMRFAGRSFWGRIATRFATWFTPPYLGRCRLASLNPKGYIAPNATIHHDDLRLGVNVCINDRVTIFQSRDGGSIELGEGVVIHQDTIIQTGEGGRVAIGAHTHVHSRCLLSAYKAPIRMGCGILIAANCAFYSYNHGFAPYESIRKQPKHSAGGITIDNDAWLGYGVIVLDGVRIGKGAVIGAGSVVTHDIPDGAVAVGVPARVVKMRSELDHDTSKQRQVSLSS